MRFRSSLLNELYKHYAPTDDTPGEDAAFEAHSLAQIQPRANVIALAAIVFALGWWPTDPFVVGRFPDAQAAFVRWRVGAPLIAIAYMLSSRMPYPRLRLSLATASIGLLFGWATAFAGGLETPWFHVVSILLFATMTLPLAFRPRLAITAHMALCLFVGFAVTRPDMMSSPYFPFASIMVSAMVILSVLLGHSLFLLYRKNFLQERQLARYNHQLEGLVIDRTAELRRLLTSIESAREDERARISRDMHDALGQELAALRYALSYTRQRYETDREGARANLAELEGLLAQVTTTTRSILHDLRPRVIDDMGLAAAAEWLVRNVEQRAGLVCSIEVTGAEYANKVTPPRAGAIFRILQEALTNATRHAKADAVQVSLVIDDEGAVALDVTDDGTGFDVEAPRRGVGLIGIRERVESMHGQAEVTSRPDFAGTRVRVRVPPPDEKAV